MRKFLLMFTCIVLLATSSYPALAQSTGTEEDYAGAVVCAPAAYLTPPGNCLPSGPSTYLTSLATLGITLPLRPLPATKPSPDLRSIPYRYFRFENNSVPVYSTLLDAQAKGPALLSFPPGFVYISYTDRDESGHYYRSQAGYWMPGNGERISELPSFQGLQFRNTPRRSFGWTIELIPVKAAPGYGSQDTGNSLKPFSIVQIYYATKVDDADWYLIGPDQWVEGRKIATVTPDPIPPEGVAGNRWIEVNLEEQTLSVYEQNQLIFATMIASGSEPFWTRPGLFQIFEKKETETMRNNDPTDFYYLENVPFTMYFDGARALHAAYWRTRFGYPQSHGCINLSVGDAHWLFLWANVGEWVYVHDPSGKTPTDPSLYTGGAY